METQLLWDPPPPIPPPVSNYNQTLFCHWNSISVFFYITSLRNLYLRRRRAKDQQFYDFISLFLYLGGLAARGNVTRAHVSSCVRSGRPVLITPGSDVTAPLPCPLCWKLFFNGSVQAMGLGFTTTCAAVTRDWPDVTLITGANRRALAGTVNGEKNNCEIWLAIRLARSVVLVPK